MARTLVGVVAGAALAISLVSASASADPTASLAVSNVKVLKTVTVVGNRQRPSVVIEVTRPTAASAAAAAHESLHAALVERTSPSAPAAPTTTP